MTRKAIVKNSRPLTREQAESVLATVERYMPANYMAALEGNTVVITGEDVAGWTLDDYVIPRLASGLIIAVEQ